MKLVIQRVKNASISIEGGPKKTMGRGLIVLFAAAERDKDGFSEKTVEKLAVKTANLRVFPDGDGKMNRSALELGLSVLVASQFTLFADTKKGNRPSFIAAAEPEFAEKVYDEYVRALGAYGWKDFLTGKFGAMMTLTIVNDGPVTIIMDTEEWERRDKSRTE